MLDLIRCRRVEWYGRNGGQRECELCSWYSLGQGTITASSDTMDAKTSLTEVIEMKQEIGLQFSWSARGDSVDYFEVDGS